MVKELDLNIGTISKVKNFANCNWNFDGTVDVISGHYVIDGKSIMGIFSLDLTNSVHVKLTADSESEIENLLESYRNVKIL